VTPVATRFLGALTVALAATAGLRVFALAGARGADPCRSPDALKATSLIPNTIALGERLEARGAATIQWSEGDVVLPQPPRLSMHFQIIRSFDGPALYANPLRYGEAFGRRSSSDEDRPPPRLQPEELRVRRERIAGRELPIHVAWDHTEAPTGPSRLVAWFFVFDNEPVESPFFAQFAGAPSLALRGPRPLTLVMISGLARHDDSRRRVGESDPGALRAAEDAAIAWLTGAWTRVLESCGPR
jgi:hypothetical protein